MLDVEYSKFKDDTIKGIREDEEQYAKLQDEIRALEAEIEAETEREAKSLKETPIPTNTAPQRSIEAAEASKTEKASPTAGQSPDPSTSISKRVTTPVQHHPPKPLHPPPFERPLPHPTPHRNDYGLPPEQQGYLPGPPNHNARTIPHPAGLPPMHPPLDLHSGHRRTPSGSVPGRGSPLPYPPQQHPQYQQYPAYNQPQHPWPPQQTYPQSHSPHAGPHFYQNAHPHQGIPPTATPIPPQYQYYPQSAPVSHYSRGQQQPWQAPLPYPPYVQLPSAATTPIQRKDGTTSRLQTPGSFTPWKRKRSDIPGLRLPSPEPPRDVSPFSDTEPQGEIGNETGSTAKSKAKLKKAENASQKTTGPRSKRRTRAGSTASSTLDRSSGSPSPASVTSDSKLAAGNKSRGSRKIKPEPTGTPLSFASDSENQRSSGRRPIRGDTLTPYDAPPRANLKRKRDSIQESSPIPSSPPYQGTRPQRTPQDPNCVTVSKTFGRVASQLLSRVTEHKFAGIFAKALSERDAPGYKTLVHRPQDLKSIKAAVTKGSKSATAAIEELEQETGETPTTLKKTEDLIPPKGIVNMEQLEMELIRMFANAIMFNPLPDAERGLGPRRSLRLSAAPNQSGELGYAGSEEGGIVQDARDMCQDVIALIETFKAAEQDRMDIDHS